MTELKTFLADVRKDLSVLDSLTTDSDSTWMWAAMDVADHTPRLLNIVETVLLHLDIADAAADGRPHPYQSIRRAIDLTFLEDDDE